MLKFKELTQDKLKEFTRANHNCRSTVFSSRMHSINNMASDLKIKTMSKSNDKWAIFREDGSVISEMPMYGTPLIELQNSLSVTVGRVENIIEADITGGGFFSLKKATLPIVVKIQTIDNKIFYMISHFYSFTFKQLVKKHLRNTNYLKMYNNYCNM